MHRDRYEDWDDADTTTPEIDPSVAGVATAPARAATGRSDRRRGHRSPTALPSAIAAALLIGALTLGATTVVPLGLVAATPTCEDEQGNQIECPTSDPGGAVPTPTPPPTDNPGTGPTDPPKDPPPTDKPPTEKPPTEKPKPDPKPDPLGLTLSNVEKGVKVDWTVCSAKRFDFYKIVRSTDARVRWPLGRHDTLVGVVRDRGTTQFIDRHAPAGKTVWYRVFCVDRTAWGHRILNSSPAKSIETKSAPKPEKPDKPAALGLDSDVTDAGVVLHWDASTADGFRWYKVVRSHGENPSYVPWTEGSQLIGVVENPSKTTFTDTHVESGQSWSYRIQAIGFWHGKKVVLGQTAAVQVTIP